LAEHLKRFRTYTVSEIEAAKYKPIQEEVLAWIDSRLKSGSTVEQMNRELKAAGVLSVGAQDVDDMEKNYAGFLGEVKLRAKGIAPDLLAVTFGIFTGSFCGYDDTAVMYTRTSLRRIARINAERSYTHGYHLREFTIGTDDGSGRRTAGSAWAASNCTSNWNGNIFRVDRLRAGSLDSILSQGESAFLADPITITQEGDTVTFDYTTMSGAPAVLVRHAIARYRAEGARAIRQAPFAPSFGGFIEEWLSMDDAEAAGLSTAEADEHHRELAARYKDEFLFEWQHAAICPGSPPFREIALRWDKSKAISVFAVSGITAEDMRMLSVSDQRSPSCQEIDISKDLSSITAEPRQ
jgi:hypothetical protein